MIKVEKNIGAVPTSLIPAFPNLFPVGTNIPRTSNTTHQKRTEIINDAAYNEDYSDRYKLDDIREALIGIYKHKCAYCEQKMERYNVEHYRPKKIYYWLAFSWDNLIMACPTCNGFKDIHFELGDKKTQVAFDNTEASMRLINSSSARYDAIEEPKMVNPEVTNPNGLIQFQMSGIIESDDERFKYTIDKCKIDRKYLNDDRRKILDVFKRHIQSAMLEPDPNTRLIQLKTIVTNFVEDSKDDELSFLAFRRYAIANNWLSDIIKDMN